MVVEYSDNKKFIEIISKEGIKYFDEKSALFFVGDHVEGFFNKMKEIGCNNFTLKESEL
ncbi:MAG: hypothetical protein GY870_14025 [archaeon]|nr:hypothetical protein [archaeon]